MMLSKYVKEIFLKWLKDNEINLDECLHNVKKKLSKDKITCLNPYKANKSDIANIYYRVAEYVFYGLKKHDIAYLIADYGLKQTNIYISPKVIIGDGFSLEFAENSKIYENVKVGDNFKVIGKVIICSKTSNSSNNFIELGDNVTLNHNVCIRGTVRIGDNVCVDGGCTILDNVDSDCEVKLVCSLQMLYSNKKNLLPSPKIYVYGVVPKFKNQIVIYGEGFYNPIVDIKIRDLTKHVDSEISYWDKNTIIVKVKPMNIDHEKLELNKIIIKSNGYKCVINNSMGLVKSLK